MNPQIKQLWLDQLAKQKQGFAQLKDGPCFCALGCLANAAVEAGQAQWVRDSLHMKDGLAVGIGALPRQIVKWAGLPAFDLMLTVNYVEGPRRAPISRHNDSYGATFQQIAEAINAQL